MKKACDRAEVRGITSPYQKDPAAYLTLAAASLIKNDGMGSGKTLLTGFPRRPPSLESPAGRCHKTVVTRVLCFWEARNVKKGGDLMGGGNHRSDDMPGAGLVSTNPSDRMIRDASDKTTAE
ncbi:hypothetical protein YC2023_031749 [Brassica napus]